MIRSASLAAVLFRGLVAVVSVVVGGATVAGQSVMATATRPVVPLLFGEDRLPLCRVVVRVEGEGPAPRIEGLSLSLQGTHRIAALATLGVVTTGREEAIAAIPRGTTLAADVRPAGTITLPVEAPLAAGDNVFWCVGSLAAEAELVDRIAVSCTALETSAGRIVVADASPDIRQRVGIALRRHGDDGVHTSRIPVLATTPAGTLLAAFDLRHRAARDLQENIDIGLSRSTDGGRTWEPVRTIMDMGEAGGLPQEQNGCGDPGILVDDVTGRIFCFGLWVHGKPGKHQWQDDGSEPGFEVGKTAQFMAVHSDDDGVTWSEPENLTRSLKEEPWWLLAPAPQAGFTRADGTLVMPVQGRNDNGRLDSFATIMTSSDRGKTWSLGSFGYRGGNECQAAELSDGSIMLNVRSDKQRFRGVAVTRDLGRTWSPHATSDTLLEEPNCNGSLLSLPRAAGHPLLLFANPLSQKERSHQTIRVSFDDGLTWPEEPRILLDEGRGRGYPSLARIGPDRVGIVYEGSQADVVFQSIPISDLVAIP
jgi:sialidase-1